MFREEDHCSTSAASFYAAHSVTAGPHPDASQLANHTCPVNNRTGADSLSAVTVE